MKEITLISVASEGYFKMLEGMVRSAELNFSRANIVIELVNLSSKHVKIAEGWHSDIVVQQVSVQKELERNFCTNRRADLFKKYRKKGFGPLVWLDADSIIRRPCNGLADHVLSCDLTMRPKVKKGRFAAGTIGVGNTPICKELVRRYCDLVKADTSWMSNQNCLNVLYGELKGRINFKPLPNTYCDVWLSDDGIIWAAKSAKKNSKKYVQELNKFLSG